MKENGCKNIDLPSTIMIHLYKIHIFITLSFRTFVFLSVIWLPHGKLWAIIEGQPHSPDVNHCVIQFQPKGHRDLRKEVGTLRSAERLVGFGPESSDSITTPYTHEITLPFTEYLSYFDLWYKRESNIACFNKRISYFNEKFFIPICVWFSIRISLQMII